MFTQEPAGQSPGRAKVPRARHGASVQQQQQPLSHRVYDLGKLDLAFADGGLKYMWLKWPKTGPGSLWRTELNSCQGKSVGLQTGHHPLSIAHCPPQGSALDPQEVKAPRRRSLSCRDSHKGRACAWGVQEAGLAMDLSQQCRQPQKSRAHSSSPLLQPQNLFLANSSTNYSKWLQSCPFWGTTRALLLNAETCHRKLCQRKLCKAQKGHEFRVNLLKIHKFPMWTETLRITVLLLQWMLVHFWSELY